MQRILPWAAALAAAVALAAAPFPAASKGRGGYGHGHGGAKLERAVEGLELDEATRARVYEIIDAARARDRELGRELRGAHGELRTLLEAESPSQEAVLAQAERVGTLRTQIHVHGLRTLLEVREAIPADQREAFAEAFQKRRHGRMKHEPRHGDG